MMHPPPPPSHPGFLLVNLGSNMLLTTFKVLNILDVVSLRALDSAALVRSKEGTFKVPRSMKAYLDHHMERCLSKEEHETLFKEGLTCHPVRHQRWTSTLQSFWASFCPNIMTLNCQRYNRPLTLRLAMRGFHQPRRLGGGQGGDEFQATPTKEWRRIWHSTRPSRGVRRRYLLPLEA